MAHISDSSDYFRTPGCRSFGLRNPRLVLRLQALGFGDLGILGLGFKLLGFGVLVLGFGFRV